MNDQVKYAMQQAVQVLTDLMTWYQVDDGKPPMLPVSDAIESLQAAIRVIDGNSAVRQPADQQPMGSYQLTIRADSGYQSTIEGRCTASQYTEACHNLMLSSRYDMDQSTFTANQYRLERDAAREQHQQLVKVLGEIYALLYPPTFRTDTGDVLHFNSPNPHVTLQRLSDAIRAIPDKISNSAKED